MLCPFAYIPGKLMRVERVELSPVQFLKLPPLPIGLHARAADAEGGTRTHTGSVFKTDAFTLYATSALVLDTGGGTRTHNETLALGDLNAARLPVPPLQLDSEMPTKRVELLLTSS